MNTPQFYKHKGQDSWSHMFCLYQLKLSFYIDAI